MCSSAISTMSTRLLSSATHRGANGASTAESHARPTEASLLGVDFTSSPSRAKPITVARGHLAADGSLRLDAVETVPTWAGFEALLAAPGPWLGAFDFPFGLPRAFVQAYGLGEDAESVIGALRNRCGDRMAFRALVDAWGNGRPAGQRLVHRRTDTALPGVRSTSPLQTRYVPVGFMYFEGVWRLMQAGVTLPALRNGDPQRQAVEAYPGLLAHELIGNRSYKNSPDVGRLIARKDIVEALEQGRTRLDVRVRMSHAQRDRLTDDASGDLLDALLCLVQAAWAARQKACGMPADVDPVEGWIVTA
jgi:hypothetical protein